MSITPTTPRDPLSSPKSHEPEVQELYDASHWETAYRHFDEDAVPQLLLHLRPVMAVNVQDLLKQKELTYLQLPPDLQKPSERPNTNIISDKDRIATSKAPQLDPRELRKIISRS